jgi:hypothetical protein
MGLYRELIRHAGERDPGLLRALPDADVLLEAEEMLGQGDLFVLGRLQKQVDVLSRIRPEVLEAALYRALDEARIDDVRLLLPHVERARPVDRARIAAAYDDLAVRGNVVGIEDLAAASAVPARVGAVAAARAYAVLAATGRVHAIDYVRQLSGLPVRLPEEAVQQGYRQLARAGRLQTLRALFELSGVRPELTLDDLLPAAVDAAGNLRLRALAEVAAAIGAAPTLTGFDRRMDAAVAAGRYADVADLLALCADADAGRVDQAVATGMAGSADLPALRFVYGQERFAAVQRRFAAAAHTRAAETGDSELQLTVYRRTGLRPSPESIRSLLPAALLRPDIEWVLEFASPEQNFPPDRTQLFLHDVRSDPRRPALERLTGVEYDEELADWLVAVRRGDLDRVREQAVDRHPLGRAIRAEPPT